MLDIRHFIDTSCQSVATQLPNLKQNIQLNLKTGGVSLNSVEVLAVKFSLRVGLNIWVGGCVGLYSV